MMLVRVRGRIMMIFRRFLLMLQLFVDILTFSVDNRTFVDFLTTVHSDIPKVMYHIITPRGSRGVAHQLVCTAFVNVVCQMQARGVHLSKPCAGHFLFACSLPPPGGDAPSYGA